MSVGKPISTFFLSVRAGDSGGKEGKSTAMFNEMRLFLRKPEFGVTDPSGTESNGLESMETFDADDRRRSLTPFPSPSLL